MWQSEFDNMIEFDLEFIQSDFKVDGSAPKSPVNACGLVHDILTFKPSKNSLWSTFCSPSIYLGHMMYYIYLRSVFAYGGFGLSLD